ncbi:NADP-dependent oxidoreductase [Cytobacillus kochii]|uniref:NADP-dependent oxidoreductase n=1 Tax=Cytobacillus kochii TaxID=859143 RepID=UPI002E226506|nr:NADP-dependent oxidoreductase [Cytobacillus kochii]
MKGIGILQYGDIHQLREIVLVTPPVGDDEILIQIKASGVLESDWQLRSGQRLSDNLNLPVILGSSGAGIIKAIGKDVSQFKVGDKVFFLTTISTYGTYANETLVPSSNVCLMPHNLTFIESAALLESSIAAWQATVEGRVREGSHVLILGSQTNVGLMLIQLLRAMGTVVGILSEDVKQKDVIHIDGDCLNPIHKQQRFDLLIDTIGQGYPYLSALRWLKPEAEVLKFTKPKFQVVDKECLSIRYITTYSIKKGLEQIKQLVEKGNLTPVLAHVYPLNIEGIQKAHIKKQYGHCQGEIVVCHRG